jgi:signal transduction histidine kinase
MNESSAFQRVRIEMESPSDLPPVSGDDRQIEQLVMNLLLNAVQASEDGEVVKVTLASIGEIVRMAIVDRGKGMEKDEARRAFEPFFTTKAKGTGLGLPICRKIVEAHGGTITLKSERGKGTRVFVDLPSSMKAGHLDRVT